MQDLPQEKVEIMKPQKTWFFQDSDGRIFPTNEKEAYSLIVENSRWRRQDIKMIGVSDGETYHRVIKELTHKVQDLGKEVSQLKETLDRYIKGHDHLLFDEFLPETDERVKRAKDMIQKTQDQLEPKQKELDELRKGIIQRAVDAELEKARGHFENPRDFTVITKAVGRQQAELEDMVKKHRVL